MANEEKNIVYLSLGSNLGNRHLNIEDAILRLSKKIDVLDISSIEETLPVGFTDQPKFLNCVVRGQSKSGIKELFGFTKGIEKEMGRVTTFKNGPRIIDIDILFYGNRIIDEADIKVPHPNLKDRLFVLKPMAELSPDFVHPVLAKTMRELLVDLEK